MTPDENLPDEHTIVSADEVPGRDGGPVDADDMAAADGLTVDDETAGHYREMVEKGAAARGEGAVE